jgi:propanediol utilization protein
MLKTALAGGMIMATVETRPPIDRRTVERIVREIVQQRMNGRSQAAVAARPELRVNISARHMHITEEHLEALFGPGAKLTVMRDLYQTGEFASEQAVTIIGPRHRMIPNLRILGPCRKASQIELSFTDSIALGIDAPVRMSGDHHDTPGCIVLGPKGHIVLEKGVIRAQRHVHMNPTEAAYYGVKALDPMELVVNHPTCGITLQGVIARIGENLKLEVHIDTDEGNACDLPHATSVELRKP